MRIAIPHWQGRIAPVFDVASHLLLVDVENNCLIHRKEVRLLKSGADARTAELNRYGATLLICGAISAPLQFRIAAAGLQVISFVCGATDDVLAAYLNGFISNRRFAMPGCQRWRWSNGEDVPPIGRAKTRGCHSELGNRARSISKAPADEAATAIRVCDLFICPNCGEEMDQELGCKRLPNQCPQCHELIERLDQRRHVRNVHSVATRRALPS